VESNKVVKAANNSRLKSMLFVQLNPKVSSVGSQQKTLDVLYEVPGTSHSWKINPCCSRL
jgi:hypothetical protein